MEQEEKPTYDGSMQYEEQDQEFIKLKSYQ